MRVLVISMVFSHDLLRSCRPSQAVTANVCGAVKLTRSMCPTNNWYSYGITWSRVYITHNYCLL